MGSGVEREASHKPVERHPPPPLLLFDVVDRGSEEYAQLLPGVQTKITAVVAVKGYGVPLGCVLTAPLDEIDGVCQVCRYPLYGQTIKQRLHILDRAERHAGVTHVC